eukprot:COSAG06_NODE_43486_length_371_cov_1.400735_1_plen_79_part_10
MTVRALLTYYARGVAALAHQGTWDYGKRHGNGSYTYHDGGKYDGAWENGQMHGPGRLQYANGDVFEVRRGATLLPALTG